MGNQIAIDTARPKCAFAGYCSAGKGKGREARLACVQREFSRGQILCRAGDRLEQLYPVHGGAFKSAILSEEGDEHITGFHVRGEVLGFDAIASGQHESTVIALEDSEVCALEYNDLEAQCKHDLGLQRLLHRLMGREMRLAQDVLVLLGSMDADARLAAYLLKLATRYQALGTTGSGEKTGKAAAGADTLQLQMSRQELAEFLGMRHETLSRVLRRLRAQRLVSANGRTLAILDRQGLQRLLPAAGARAPAKPQKATRSKPKKQASARQPDRATPRGRPPSGR